jgi:hypothetical protein
MKVALASLLPIVLYVSALCGQTTPAGKASSSGACSPSHVGNNNSYVINCNGIGAAQGKKIVELLNKVLTNSDLAAVNAKLDELVNVASRPNQTVNAPNGIGMIGGTLVNPTVNNFVPLTRHIPESIKSSLISCLSVNPGTVTILAPVNDAEAAALAGEWQDIFSRANWSIADNKVGYYMMGGGPISTGTRITVNGTIDADGKNPKYDPSSPSGSVVACIIGKPSDGSSNLTLSTDVPKNHVSIMVGPRPIT